MKKKLKYKVGDILVWHRPWFDSSMDMKVVIVGINDSEFPYRAKFYKPDKHTYTGYNIFKEEELFEIGKEYQMSLFDDNDFDDDEDDDE